MTGGLHAIREYINELWSEFLTLFSNVLFAVSLFAAWGVMTLIGVIVDQGKDPSFYTQNYVPALARLVLRLDLNNIYHSAGYVGVIGIILVSLAVCTFKRVIPARLPPLRAVVIEKIPLNASLEVAGDERAIRSRIENFFTNRGWTIRRKELSGTEWTFADKHNWARRGVLVAHVGFVIIAAGTTLYWWKGFSGETAILTGQTVTIPQSGATLHLDRFNYQFTSLHTRSGLLYQPIDYVSALHVAGRDGTMQAEILRVNHPIDIDNTLYYQASYGFAVTFQATKAGNPITGIPTTPLKEGEGFALGQTTRSIHYTQFVGTLEHHANGQLSIGRDPRPNDPGVLLDVFDGDELVGRVLTPIGKTVDLGDGYTVTATRPILFSALEYRHDPGIPLVGIGAFVLLAGLCISFYLLPARLYVHIKPHASSRADIWNVGIAAMTVKGYDIFEEEFRDLIADLQYSENPEKLATTSYSGTISGTGIAYGTMK
jgi:cytochrome c biogenesis protein